jgi:hypothetical protein
MTFLIPGGNLTVSQGETVGNNLTGTINQSGGTNIIPGGFHLALGYYEGSNGTYLLSGAASLSAGGELLGIGGLAVAVFNQSGGANTATSATGIMAVGAGPYSTGTYYLSGGSLQVPGLEIVGWDESTLGTFVQTGGTNILTNTTAGYGLFLGAAGNSSSYSLSGTGQLSVASIEVVGETGGSNSHFNQSGGRNFVGGPTGLELGSSARAFGMYSLTGGTLTLNGAAYVGGSVSSSNTPVAGGTGVLTISGTGVLTAGSITLLNTSGSAIIISGGTANIGQLNLSGVPGSFKWSAGTLNIGSGGLNLGGGTLTVPTGGTLAGSPTLSGGLEISNDATLSPTLVSSTSLLMDTGSTLQDNLLADVAGTLGGYGEASITGAITLNNPALSLNFEYAPALGDSYTVLSDAGILPIIGTFAGLPQGAMFTEGDPSGRTDLFEISYTGGAGGNSVVVTTVAVPDFSGGRVGSWNSRPKATAQTSLKCGVIAPAASQPVPPSPPKRFAHHAPISRVCHHRARSISSGRRHQAVACHLHPARDRFFGCPDPS